MSFIRCTSNPEGLYVYHECGGNIVWDHKNITIRIPANIFYTFVKKLEWYGEDFKRGSLEIKEVYYPNRRKLNRQEKKLKKLYPNLKLPRGEFKITLFYKNQEVARMWRVTWRHIYENIMEHIKK